MTVPTHSTFPVMISGSVDKCGGKIGTFMYPLQMPFRHNFLTGAYFFGFLLYDCCNATHKSVTVVFSLINGTFTVPKN